LLEVFPSYTSSNADSPNGDVTLDYDFCHSLEPHNIISCGSDLSIKLSEKESLDQIPKACIPFLETSSGAEQPDEIDELRIW
jgi:hypothetical protein